MKNQSRKNMKIFNFLGKIAIQIANFYHKTFNPF